MSLHLAAGLLVRFWKPILKLIYPWPLRLMIVGWVVHIGCC